MDGSEGNATHDVGGDPRPQQSEVRHEVRASDTSADGSGDGGVRCSVTGSVGAAESLAYRRGEASPPRGIVPQPSLEIEKELGFCTIPNCLAEREGFEPSVQV